MKCNEVGLDIIKTFEGFSSVPYKCPAGYWTIGYGSIWDHNGNRVTKNHPTISEEEAEELLRREVEHAEKVISLLVSVPLTENQFSSLCSFIYNVGSGNFKASTLRSKLQRMDYVGASNEFPKWRRAGGKILRGLVIRREKEKELFNA